MVSTALYEKGQKIENIGHLVPLFVLDIEVKNGYKTFSNGIFWRKAIFCGFLVFGSSLLDILYSNIPWGTWDCVGYLEKYR